VALRTVGVRLTADISQYTSALGRAGAATKDFQGKLDKAAQSGKLDKVADAAGIAGIGLAGLGVGAVKMAADFDKAMSGVHAAILGSGGTVKDLNALRQAALQAGKETSFSATQAADGITELSKAGVSTADVLNGGLKGALDLAAAGQLSVGEAAETAASAMTQFKLSGSQVPHIADLLAAGAGKAQGSVHDMGAALNQSGLVAAQFGLSIEDTTGVLAEFASAGLLGSDAGTSFKTMLLALANPSKQSRDLMTELGISFYDAQGKFVGVSGAAQILQTRLKGLTVEQRNQALGQIFGNDAIRAASILYTDGAAGVQKWKNAVNDSGYAAKTAQIQTDNLAGDIERLKGSIETLAIQSGSGANGGLRELVKILDHLIGTFSSLPPFVGSTITVLAGLSGAALILGAGWLKLRKTTAELRVELDALGPSAARATAGMSRLAGAAGKVSLVFAALQVAGEVIGHFQKDLNPQLDALAVGLQKYAETGKTAGETSRVLGNDMGNLKKTFDLVADTGAKSTWARNIQGGLESFVPGLKGANDSLTQTRERIGAVDAALAQMVSSGNASGASQAFQALASQLATGKVSMEEFRKQFPQYAAAVESAGGATKSTTGNLGDLNSALDKGAAAQDKYKTAADVAAGAARGEREALGALFSTLKAETDPVFALIEAQKKLKDAQKAYTAAVKAHGAKSDEARAADLDLAAAALGLEGAVGSLSSTFNGKLDPAFVATLHAAGLTKTQIAQVEQQFKTAKTAATQFAGKYAADASAPGATTAKKQLDLAYTAANHFAGPYKANVSVTGYSDALGKLNRLSVYQQALKTGKIPAGFNGPIKGPDGKYYADGGQVGGWSPHSRADNIPAWLTANEWVHPVDSVKYYGPQVMRAIQHRKVPREVLAGFASGELGKLGDLPLGLASGGQVVWPFPTTASRTRIPSRAEVESKIPGGSAGAFLHAQDGKPYVWASAGPGGYDCSGIASAVYLLLHGKNPYHHIFSTASLPGGWFPKPGIGGPLTVAWSNQGEAPASSTTGHMMGMAGGLTFESTGSRGVHLGRTTRRLTDFAHIAHYAQGGPVAHTAMKYGGMITEPVFGVGASGRTYSFGENYQREKVTPMWQSAGGGGGGVTNVNLTINAAVGSHPREIGAEVINYLGAYLQGGGELRVNGQKVL